MRRRPVVLSWLLPFLFLGSVGTARAEHALVKDLKTEMKYRYGDDETHTMTDEQRKKAEEQRKKMEDFEKTIQTLTGLSGKIGLAVTGDETDTLETGRFDVTVDLSYGVYPDELRFRTVSGINLDKNELTDRLSVFLLNYDRNLGRDGEAFVFADRASSSLMSIDARYEVGVGLKREWGIGGLTPAGERARSLIAGYLVDYSKDPATTGRMLDLKLARSEQKRAEDELESARLALVNAEECPESKSQLNYLKSALDSANSALRNKITAVRTAETELALSSSGATESDGIPKRLGRMYRGVEERYSRIRLGIAASALMEYERAVIETPRYTSPSSDTTLKPNAKVTIPTEQNVLISIRPSLTWRLRDDLSVRAVYFLKTNPVLLRDHRRETNIQIDYEGKGTDGLNVGLTFLWYHLWDNTPPRIDEAQVNSLAATTVFVRPVSAEQRLSGIRASLTVKI